MQALSKSRGRRFYTGRRGCRIAVVTVSKFEKNFLCVCAARHSTRPCRVSSIDDRPDLSNAFGTPLAEQESTPQYHVLAVVLHCA